MGHFALLVLWNGLVKHYMVHLTDDGKVYINQKSKFTSVIDLVNYYMTHGDALCTRLNKPCQVCHVTSKVLYELLKDIWSH